MRSPTLFVVVAATLPLLGLSCPTSPVSSCEAMLRAQCEFSFRCCDAEERLDGSAPSGALGGSYVTSESECAERSIGLCKAFAGGNDDSVRLGRMTFDAEAANACIAAINAARDQCDSSLMLDAQRAGQPCSRALGVGTVEPGDTCASAGECRLGGSCVIDLEDPEVNEEEGAAEGECVELADEGDDCAATSCGTGLVCDGGECEPLPAEGEDCFAGSACAAGLFCDDGECAVPKANGENCDSSLECLSSECDDGECAGADVCNGV